MSADAPQSDGPVVQIDIISDVMCPWCIIGYKQLEQALGMVGVGAFVRWHPFELNPAMPPEGQNLRAHITEKYGSTKEQSTQARQQLKDLGAELGFAFNFSDDSKIVNSFEAHQLLGWAQTKGLQHPLKMALFDAHFSQQQDVSDRAVLIEVAAGIGLDRAEASEVLTSGCQVEETRAHEQFWTSRGVSGVPSIVFDGKYLLTGAQGAETYAQMLQKVLSEKELA